MKKLDGGILVIEDERDGLVKAWLDELPHPKDDSMVTCLVIPLELAAPHISIADAADEEE